MTDTELIAKQAHEIELLRGDLKLTVAALNKISLSMVCIGGPLNDNIHRYSNGQRRIFHEFENLINETLGSCESIHSDDD